MRAKLVDTGWRCTASRLWHGFLPHRRSTVVLADIILVWGSLIPRTHWRAAGLQVCRMNVGATMRMEGGAEQVYLKSYLRTEM